MFVNKIRRKTMTYNKPEVAKLNSAVEAIQAGVIKHTQTYLDANGVDFNATATAYEADE